MKKLIDKLLAPWFDCELVNNDLCYLEESVIRVNHRLDHLEAENEMIKLKLRDFNNKLVDLSNNLDEYHDEMIDFFKEFSKIGK